jgi:hypothetical protein
MASYTAAYHFDYTADRGCGVVEAGTFSQICTVESIEEGRWWAIGGLIGRRFLTWDGFAEVIDTVDDRVVLYCSGSFHDVMNELRPTCTCRDCVEYEASLSESAH